MKKRITKALAFCLVLALVVPALSLASAGGTRQLTLYWTSPDADYEKCDVWIWFPGKDGSGHLFEPCDYGVRTSVEVPEGVDEVGFIVRRDCSAPGGSSWGSATKDVEEDRFAVLTGSLTEIFLQPGDSMQYTSPDGGKTLNPVRMFKLAGIISPSEIRYAISPAVRLEKMDAVHVRLDGEEIAVESLSSLGNKSTTASLPCLNRWICHGPIRWKLTDTEKWPRFPPVSLTAPSSWKTTPMTAMIWARSFRTAKPSSRYGRLPPPLWF